MKFTMEDLAKSMGLKIGDIIKLENCIYTIERDYYIYNEQTQITFPLLSIINEEFEILTPKNKVGELKCYDLQSCKKCPLKSLYCPICKSDDNLYNVLEEWFKKYEDKEIYDIMKKRLEEEVDNNDQ